MLFLPAVKQTFTFRKTERCSPVAFIAMYKKAHYMAFLGPHSWLCVQVFWV